MYIVDIPHPAQQISRWTYLHVILFHEMHGMLSRSYYTDDGGISRNLPFTIYVLKIIVWLESIRIALLKIEWFLVMICLVEKHGFDFIWSDSF